jgi:hypothetical protein
MKRSTGVDCPGCGLSRCFICLAHGRVADAVRHNPWGLVLFVAVVAQLPYRAVQIGRVARGRQPWSHPFLAAGAWLLLAGLIVQWLVRITGLLFL